MVTLDQRYRRSFRGEFGLTRWTVSGGFCVRVVCVAIAIASAPSVFALSFGSERVQSALGQPLRMTIPLLGATGDSLEARCFRVVAPTRADGLSTVSQARVELQSSTNPPTLLIRSARSVDEPVVRITVEAGCDTPIRRDYTILLDPPPLQQTALPPVIEAISPPTTEQSRSSAAAVISGTAKTPDASADRANDKKDLRPSRNKQAQGNRKPASGKATQSPEKTAPRAAAAALSANNDQLLVQGGQSSAGGSIEDASLAALAVPRLKVSSDLSAFDTAAPMQPGAGDELQAAIAKERRARLLSSPIEEDLAPRLEADFVVAKRRIAELQAQLSAAGVSPSGAPVTAAKNASVTVATSTGWDWRRWLWVPAVLLVVGLLAFLFRQWRAQREKPQFANGGPITVISSADDEFDTVMPSRTVARATAQRASAEPATVGHEQFAEALAEAANAPVSPPSGNPPSSLVSAGMDASDRLNHPLFPLNDGAPHLDVTELSQVTDEAQVYADLGRNDQAIEILRSHIDSLIGERSSPAPWLMIFDLYRRTNNRAGYDELAPQFRRHFNGRMPDWDSYGHELALDDGLEAFPHLVARIERDWGTADARKFLEELLYDNRGGSRLGFSLAAYRDILLLLQIHEGLGASAEGLKATDWESRGADGTDGTPKWDLELDVIEPPQSGELDSFLKNMPPPDKT